MDDSKKLVFHTQHFWYSNKITKTTAANTGFAHVKARKKGPNAKGKSRYMLLPLNKKLPAIDTYWHRKIHFLQWSLAGYINDTSG